MTLDLSQLASYTTPTETVRLISEVIALMAVVGGGVVYIVRQIWRVLREVEASKVVVAEISDHLATLNGSVVNHYKDDSRQFEGIGKSLSHIEGQLEERAKIADAAAAAAVLLAQSTAEAAARLAAATAEAAAAKDSPPQGG